MSYWTEYTEFNKYVDAFGSNFAAINYVAQVARRRRQSVHNCILESQALAWVVTGIEPKGIQEYYAQLKLLKQRKQMYVDDRLLYIDDIDVRNAVKVSIHESQQAHHLIYSYKDVTDTYQQARVRILCRMIWDELLNLEAADKI